MDKNNFIPSVNFHLWKPCNMRCGFCFASFQDVKNPILPKEHLSKEESLEVVNKLADYGFEKITFAGGEPTLCPWLSELISTAKNRGMTTMVVSNGSGINNDFLMENRDNLDWIALSIDSLSLTTNKRIGRVSSCTKPNFKHYDDLIGQIKDGGYRLKINTVVNSKNYQEDFNAFISKVQPERWKVFQALPVKGQNDSTINEFLISNNQFWEFVKRHKKHQGAVSESNSEMVNSYVMIDPAGRFFNNHKGFHTYSRPILEAGIKEALHMVNYSFSRFVKRRGFYNWG